MREPRNIQRFLNKIFEGIDNLSFLPSLEVNALHSREGETVGLGKEQRSHVFFR